MSSPSNALVEVIVNMLESLQITSANPNWTNYVKEFRYSGISKAFDSELKRLIEETVGDMDFTGDGTPTIDPNATSEESTTPISKEKQLASKVGQGVNTLNNPAGIVEQGLKYLPHTALVALAVALVPLIFEELTRPGGMLDLRWKRMLENEFNGFLSRQAQKDTQMGVRQVIVQGKTGFTASNGLNNFNTMRGIREGGIDKDRLGRTAIVDHTKGIFND